MKLEVKIGDIKAELEIKPITILVGEDANVWLGLIGFAASIAGQDAKLYHFPEAYRHPTVQRDIANEIGHLYNQGTKLLIATHSPYILAQLNNLLLAKSLYKETRKEEIREKYEGLWIDPEDIAVYEVKGAQVKNLINEEGLIEARAIDAVSDEIVKETDELLEIAYGGVKGGNN